MAVVLRDLRDGEVPAAAALLAQASRDAPIPAAVLHDPRHRARSLRRLCTTVLSTPDAGERICACDGDTVVGVVVLARGGPCERAPWHGARLVPLLPALGTRTWTRTIAWRDALRVHDLDGPHAHLDPLALDPRFPGRSIGAALLGETARRLDATGQVGYTATGRREQLAAHERHGFHVVWHTSVFGVTTWFLRRDPAPPRPPPNVSVG